MCRYGHGVVRGIFEKFETESLKGFVVFLPMLKGDDEDAATTQSKSLGDNRVEQVWDLERQMGHTVPLARSGTSTYVAPDHGFAIRHRRRKISVAERDPWNLGR